MGYDHGDSFPFDFEPNGIPFGSKGKLSPGSYPIQSERNWKYSFFSDAAPFIGRSGIKNIPSVLVYGVPRNQNTKRVIGSCFECLFLSLRSRWFLLSNVLEYPLSMMIVWKIV